MKMMVLKCIFFGVQTHNKTNIITTQKKTNTTQNKTNNYYTQQNNGTFKF